MRFWKDKNVLITGHTGFKGSWLSLWLEQLGANVIGYSLESSKPSLFDITNIKENINSNIGDLRDYDNLNRIIEKYQPEIVFHLAAQALVRKSYIEPRITYETNVIGTVNLFDSLKNSSYTKVVINITSDKCYKNNEWDWGYRENDRLGGDDPYSCSKACSELITESFRKSIYNDKNIALASVRAGNVIGGGDWADNRIVPDIVRNISSGKELYIRNPYAIRPWQYVLEPLYGYLLLAEKIYQEGLSLAEAWNFGPDESNTITVIELVKKFEKYLGSRLDVKFNEEKKFNEAQILKLDCSKAKNRLKWVPRLGIDETIKWTVDWYKSYLNKEDMRKLTIKQIEQYQSKVL